MAESELTVFLQVTPRKRSHDNKEAFALLDGNPMKVPGQIRIMKKDWNA